MLRIGVAQTTLSMPAAQESVGMDGARGGKSYFQSGGQEMSICLPVTGWVKAIEAA